MNYFLSESNNVHYNLALEEYLFKNKEEEFFFLWVNHSCVVIGCNQNTMAEINYEFIKKENVKVARRITGGGAVYHDKGNLNFSFIKNKENCRFKDEGYDFSYFGQFIVDALKTLNLDVKVDGRNDILLGERKISGNAQSVYKDRVLHHGTLMIDLNIDDLISALTVDAKKLEGKGVKSVRSRVTNLNENVPESFGERKFTTSEIADVIRENVLEDNFHDYEISEDDLAEIDKLYKEKTSTWDWIYGKSPKYNFTKSEKLEKGNVQVFFEIEKGIIKTAKIYGDFFGKKPISDIEQLLTGVKHDYDSIYVALSGVEHNFSEYIFGSELKDFIGVTL